MNCELLMSNQNKHACLWGCRGAREIGDWQFVLLINGSDGVLRVLNDMQVFLLSFSSSSNSLLTPDVPHSPSHMFLYTHTHTHALSFRTRPHFRS